MTMNLGTIPPLDLAVLGLLLLFWLGSGWFSENPPATRPSVSWLMEEYRRDWMKTFVTRQPRIFDATLIDSLRQGTAFFASACMIAIGGGVAVIGNAAAVERLADELPITGGPDVAVKMLPVIVFLANALLKFVWAHRLFGYCSILMAAVPNDPGDPQAFHRAGQAAEINITAAKSFNRGLRSIYYALAALGWLLGPWGLLAGTVLATGILIRREFASHSRAVILMRER
ncbi:DUF599 domain-containing protein [Tabrizicola sp.]|jgi:uncharacterized membrane protein|uniref:DUF599 domain-containing protein n=1 Tax=Tabrizicola sp. TaxID=2005166 RepID=UPI001A601E7A|nr:DUF599 domain-containing protein [Tabrizicola sp.]MBL9064260.1 DUF599 domain-containing protein [Tabrizicola sp.]